MKTVVIGKDLEVSQIALGCMRIAKLSVDELEELVLAAVENGINFFDHADIYGGTKSESLFGEVLAKNPGLREKIIIQTKCGIRKGFYDSSKEHILKSVNDSLRRLQTDYIDVLLIHRPDTLMDYHEISDAFNQLYNENKVKYFGVSNMNSMQMELLKCALNHRLVANQLQFSIVHSGIIDSGINVNMKNNFSVDHDGSILEYCRLNSVTIQAWSVLQASWEEGTFLDNPNYKDLNNKLEELGNKYNVSKAAIAISFILRHPAGIQAIVGTTKVKHLVDLTKAYNVSLTREEWYSLYLSSGKLLP
ncbi:MAG: aldo/keto reductase [Bacilli bacterium]